MKIGITERGDAGLDLSWADKLDTVDGAVIITKNINKAFGIKLLEADKHYKLILHATCTGWGGTVFEPNVPDYKTQLTSLAKLIADGFDVSRVVLRIDPIFPTQNGLERVDEILAFAEQLGIVPKARVRVSVFDNYKHVSDRLREKNLPVFYNGSFKAPPEDMRYASDKLNELIDKYNIRVECCAEPDLMGKIIHRGCISLEDITFMGLTIPTFDTIKLNPQDRSGCLCLPYKTELLDSKHRCAHKCIYCYWYD